MNEYYMGILTYNPAPFNKDTQQIFTWIDSLPSIPGGFTYTLTINGQTWNTSLQSTSTSINFTIEPPMNSYGTFNANVSNESTYNKNLSVSINCFVKGTTILCENDEYKKIEDLNINDNVKTFKNGLKKIKYILNRKIKNENTMHQIHKINNLYITGGHSLLVDDLTDKEREKTLSIWGELKKIDDKYLLLSCVSSDLNVEKINDDNIYEIYHIVLENENKNGQYGIYANGILTETMSIQCYEEALKYQINFV